MGFYSFKLFFVEVSALIWLQACLNCRASEALVLYFDCFQASCRIIRMLVLHDS